MEAFLAEFGGKGDCKGIDLIHSVRCVRLNVDAKTYVESKHAPNERPISFEFSDIFELVF